MKKLLSLIAISSASLLSADYYHQGQPYYNDGYYNQGYYYNGQYSYDNQPYYYNQGYSYSNQPYYYSNNQGYSYSNQPYYNQGYSYSNQPYYYQNSQGYSYSNQPSYNQGYSYSNQPEYVQKGQYYEKTSDYRNSQPYYYQNGQYYQKANDQRSSDQGSDVRQGSDQDISNKVRDALSSGWFSRGFENVNASVSNGVVTLTGSVETQDQRSKVEERVRKIDGVRQVNNQITVSKGGNVSYDDYSSRQYSNNQYQDSQYSNNPNQYSNSMYSDNQYADTTQSREYATTDQDRQINNRIREKLSNASRKYDVLVIRTDNGVVVISGMVERPDDVKKVNELVKSVNGVKSVDNQATVKKNNM